LKKIEKESLLKSFLLFFVSQALLVGGLLYLEYIKELKNFDDELFNKMRVCSFDLKCEDLKIDFVPKENYELYKIYKEKEYVGAYFSILGSDKNSLKIYTQMSTYKSKAAKIKQDTFFSFLLVLVAVGVLSLLFSLYALSPFRNALRLTEEFIKDILHDFNTPLSTLRLNSSMLKSELGENSKINRIENSVATILSLQSNLRAYLDNHSSQKESFDLQECIKSRVSLIEKNFETLSFELNIPKTSLSTNKDAFIRVVDNLISNAAKYNKQGGKVIVSFENDVFSIQDTGKGIKNPKRIFERFYKEQDRGIGIGLHIVQKLCEELKIDISVQSEVNRGTLFRLNLKNII